MDDLDAIPSISSGSVGSRFVSQADIETAKARRDEQWKAAYARLGQEPPPAPTEDAFDGRSLAEKLAANRAAKQEEWEERNKLGNQFRALEEDEVLFLDSVLEKQREEERLRKEMDGEELKNFREAVAARETAANRPPIPISTSDSSSPRPATGKNKTAPMPVTKKDTKKSLKGVLVKKKPKPDVTTSLTPVDKERNDSSETQVKRRVDNDTKASDVTEPQTKRRRVSESSH
ncbi:hypothetical protein AcV5_004695 [Taiwanofungus camphoratus]|nr:hypothetical protein AcW2_000703 [Antrodia cinnamomea]KAI0936600.1 hypothetical protein AcV5_004695 [Antrodia cinnamomea]